MCIQQEMTRRGRERGKKNKRNRKEERENRICSIPHDYTVKETGDTQTRCLLSGYTDCQLDRIQNYLEEKFPERQIQVGLVEIERQYKYDRQYPMDWESELYIKEYVSWHRNHCSPTHIKCDMTSCPGFLLTCFFLP